MFCFLLFIVTHNIYCLMQNGQYLDLCVSLGSSSSYSALEDDHVFLEEREESATPIAQDETRDLPTQSNTMSRPTETSIELQVKLLF